MEATAKTPRRAAIEASVLAATEALLREGATYAELNVERIATRAGISRTAFYFYFRDKRELLERVTGGVSDLLFEEADRWWSGDGDGPEELRTALRNIVGVYREHGALLRAVVEASTYDEEVARFWRDLIGRFVEATRMQIETDQAAGRVSPGLPAEGVAFALCWMTERTIYQRMVADGAALDVDAAVDSLAAVWLGAVYGAA
jgi:TetR/AcrR family transcriptional regulator, ethionamide resistance regulator